MTMDCGDSNEAQKTAVVKKMCQGLQSEDRRTRKQTLIELQNFLGDKEHNFSTEELRNLFNETQMHTLNTLRDKTENVREQGIKFTSFFIIDILPLNDFYLTYVFPVLVERIGSVEIIEESEEIRLMLVHLLNDIITKYSNTEQLKPFLGDCVEILKETVKDKHPAIRELSCLTIVNLAGALPRDFHMQAENLIKPVLTCFPHQRFKVRVEAIKCIGEIIMHSTYKGLDLAIVPMAEKLFDQIAIVRRTVAQVAARWLLDYRDRYSFFNKLLPLLLTGLNDEVTETREEAHKLWEIVGLQYQQENEKDLKDQMDFLIKPPKYYLENIERPNLGCRVMVQRSVGKLAHALSNEMGSWQADVRVRCSQLLCAVALHSEDHFTMHLQDLLPAMFLAARDDDSRVKMNIVRASEIIGLFVPYKTWKLLLFPAIENGAHFGHLTVLHSLIKGAPQEFIWEHLEEISEILAQDDLCYTRKKKMQQEIVLCVASMCEKIKLDPKQLTLEFNLFKILVAQIALKDVENNDIITPALLENLAKTFEKSTNELWKKNTGTLLLEIKKHPKAWMAITSERCIFEVVLTECGEAFSENLDTIGEILKETLNPEADPESRLKTFLALSDAFENKSVIFQGEPKGLSNFFEELIVDVFVPSLVWHAGRTAEAMRTMVATCLKIALTPIDGVDLFKNGDTLRPLFDKLLPLLLSLIEDASSRSRNLAIECILVLKQNAVLKNIWGTEDLIKIYPEILKRLDDPTENVRQCAISVLPSLFDSCPDGFKESTFKAHHELLIDTLFVHFDDPRKNIQELVYDAILCVSKINRQLLEEKVQRHRPLVRNQEGCDTIINYLKNLNL